jgi:single-strand DNA-binding protein
MPATRPSKQNTPATAPKNATVYGQREDGALCGNLTRNPELRFTPKGRPVASTAIAVNERVQNKETGIWEDTDPEFWDITVWGIQAEYFCEACQKGDRVVTTGYFQDVTYTNKDGEEVTRTRFTARDIGPSLLFKNVVIKRTERMTT